MSAANPDVGSLAVTLSPRDGVSIGPDIEVMFVRVVSNDPNYQSIRVVIQAPKNIEISRFRRRHNPPVKSAQPVDELEETLKLVRAAAASYTYEYSTAPSVLSGCDKQET